ncbi:uncharacterized protein [Cicer arietinum]|uniref:Uncharacterized protein LOC105852583 n=1 Tax=Cicer arietinum TaxID=3827 RepID=A0A1S3EF85_CICAR|nr:uncharacterized protein LOC105852583 [Cicer arietinum]
MDEATSATRALNGFHRQDPPKFKGEHDPDKADLWLQEIDKISEILHCSDNAKLEYATYLMIGEAEYWWRGAKKLMETNHVELTWEAFRNKFLYKYFPKSAKAKKEAQFLKLYSGNLTIAEYAAKLESLAKHFRYFLNQIDEEYMCEWFEIGIRYEIKELVGPLEIRQYQTQGHNDQQNREDNINKTSRMCDHWGMLEINLYLKMGNVKRQKLQVRTRCTLLGVFAATTKDTRYLSVQSNTGFVTSVRNHTIFQMNALNERTIELSTDTIATIVLHAILPRLVSTISMERKPHLPLNLSKLEEVKFLGHVISRKGIVVDPIKVQAVVAWKQPQTVT